MLSLYGMMGVCVLGRALGRVERLIGFDHGEAGEPTRAMAILRATVLSHQYGEDAAALESARGLVLGSLGRPMSGTGSVYIHLVLCSLACRTQHTLSTVFERRESRRRYLRCRL